MRKALTLLVCLVMGGCSTETPYQVAWHSTNLFCLATALPAMGDILKTAEQKHAGEVVCTALKAAAPAGDNRSDELPRTQ